MDHKETILVSQARRRTETRTAIQAFISLFTSLMSWLILGFALIGLTLLGLEARRLQQGRCRACMGLIAMLMILVAAAVSLVRLSVRISSGRHDPLLSQWLLPLVVLILLVALYRLSFPPFEGHFASRRASLKTVVLLLLSVGAAVSAGGLVVLDFLFS